MEDDFSSWITPVEDRQTKLNLKLGEVQMNVLSRSQLDSQLHSLYHQVALICIDMAHNQFSHLYNNKHYCRVRSTLVKSLLPQHLSRSRKFHDAITMLDPWPVINLPSVTSIN